MISTSIRLFNPLLAGLALLMAAPVSAQEFPELTGRVVDAANIIPDSEEAALTAKLEALETQTERQFVVATVPTLNGDDIANYGYQLGREWGIGDAERDDGVLLLIAPNDKKVRIEVGYGLEPVLTDGFSTLIVQNKILPRFREQDFSGGINAGADAIISQLQLPPEEARAIAEQADERRNSGGGFPIGTLIWFAMIFFFFILPAMRRGGQRRRGGVVGDIILWEVGSAIARGAMSGGSGGGGWGGGGGGGFSGGGGSFGGGGASGGW